MLRSLVNFTVEYLWWIPAAFFAAFISFAIYMSMFGPEIPLEERNHSYLKAECVRRGYGKLDRHGHFRLYPAANTHEGE